MDLCQKSHILPLCRFISDRWWIRILKNAWKADFPPGADLILAASPVRVDDSERIRGKTVLVVEDGPTLTHGGMAFGAGFLATQQYDAATIVDPRPYALGTLAKVFEQYPHIGRVLPAMGYSEEQIQDLAATFARTP
jgi:predicted GTPase